MLHAQYSPRRCLAVICNAQHTGQQLMLEILWAFAAFHAFVFRIFEQCVRLHLPLRGDVSRGFGLTRIAPKFLPR